MLRLSDEQWERIRNHFPEESIAAGRAGRKPIPTRTVLEAVLWILVDKKGRYLSYPHEIVFEFSVLRGILA
ncbi:MAG: transposase [Gammaproteobacteria bacterium]